MNSEVLSTSETRVVFGNTAGFKMYFSPTVYSDNGTAIESYADSPLRTFGDLSDDSCLRRIYAPFVNTSGTLKVYTAIGDTGEWTLVDSITTDSTADRIGIDFAIGTSATGADSISGTKRINAQARGRRTKVRFYQSSATEYYELQAPIELMYKSNRRTSA